MSFRFLLAILLNAPVLYSGRMYKLTFALGSLLLMSAFLLSAVVFLTWGEEAINFARLALGLGLVGLVLLYHNAVDIPK